MCRSLGTERGIRVKVDEGQASCGVHLATVQQYRRVRRPLTPPSKQVDGIELLPGAQFRERCPWQLATIVSACGFDAPGSGGSVEQQDHALDLMQVHEIAAFRAHLLRSADVRAARRQGAAATGT